MHRRSLVSFSAAALLAFAPLEIEFDRRAGNPGLRASVSEAACAETLECVVWRWDYCMWGYAGDVFRSGRLQGLIVLDQDVTSIAVSPDGQRLYGGLVDPVPAIGIWSVPDAF